MATITRENIGLLNDKIVVKIEKNDYLPSFEKALKNYGKQANIPGFRKGMVPSGLIKKMYGNSVLTDEVLRTVEKELTNYMSSEKLDIFAQPLPLPENDASQIDVNRPIDYAFSFEVGLKPEFALADLPKAKLTRYNVTITEEMINQELERLQVRHGKMTEPETVTSEENVLNVTFTESDESGNPVEGGISKENSLLVKYFTADFRPKWMGRKKDDTEILQLKSAFDEKEREWVVNDLGLAKEDETATEKYFNVLITKVGLIEKAELNEEFYLAAFPGKTITNEAELRDAIKEEINTYWSSQSRNQLQHSIYHTLLDQTHIEFPESFLKRWMQQSGEKLKSTEEVDQEFPNFVNQLKWTLIIDKVIRGNQLEVTPDDIREFAKKQLFSYMGSQLQDQEQPWIADYVNRMMQDKKFVEDAVHRVETEKVFGWAETQVNPVETEIAAEEFSKMQEEHQHHHH